MSPTGDPLTHTDAQSAIERDPNSGSIARSASALSGRLAQCQHFAARKCSRSRRLALVTRRADIMSGPNPDLVTGAAQPYPIYEFAACFPLRVKKRATSGCCDEVSDIASRNTN